MSENCVLFFKKSEVIFTKWCFIFVLFFDKSDYDHCSCFHYRLQQSFGKVIFSQVSVSHSVHKGRACMAGGVGGRGGMCGVHGRGVRMVGHVWQGACMTGGCVWHGRCAWQEAHVWQGGMHGTHPHPDTTRYGQWAGGTHPTGMHSCFHFAFGKLLPINTRFAPNFLRLSRLRSPIWIRYW